MRNLYYSLKPIAYKMILAFPFILLFGLVIGEIFNNIYNNQLMLANITGDTIGALFFYFIPLKIYYKKRKELFSGLESEPEFDPDMYVENYYMEDEPLYMSQKEETYKNVSPKINDTKKNTYSILERKEIL